MDTFLKTSTETKTQLKALKKLESLLLFWIFFLLASYSAYFLMYNVISFYCAQVERRSSSDKAYIFPSWHDYKT